MLLQQLVYSQKVISEDEEISLRDALKHIKALAFKPYTKMALSLADYLSNFLSASPKREITLEALRRNAGTFRDVTAIAYYANIVAHRLAAAQAEQSPALGQAPPTPTPAPTELEVPPQAPPKIGESLHEQIEALPVEQMSVADAYNNIKQIGAQKNLRQFILGAKDLERTLAEVVELMTTQEMPPVESFVNLRNKAVKVARPANVIRRLTERIDVLMGVPGERILPQNIEDYIKSPAYRKAVELMGREIKATEVPQTEPPEEEPPPPSLEMPPEEKAQSRLVDKLVDLGIPLNKAKKALSVAKTRNPDADPTALIRAAIQIHLSGEAEGVESPRDVGKLTKWLSPL